MAPQDNGGDKHFGSTARRVPPVHHQRDSASHRTRCSRREQGLWRGDTAKRGPFPRRRGNKQREGMSGTHSRILCANSILLTRVQLYHGEVHTIKRFYEIPAQQRPSPKDCVFLTTHEPCSLCLRYAAYRVRLSSNGLIRPLARSPGPGSIVSTICSPTKTPATHSAYPTTSRSYRRYSRHLRRAKHPSLWRRVHCTITRMSSLTQQRWQTWWKQLKMRRIRPHSQRRLRISKGDMLLCQKTIRSKKVQLVLSLSSSKPSSVCTELFVVFRYTDAH